MFASDLPPGDPGEPLDDGDLLVVLEAQQRLIQAEQVELLSMIAEADQRRSFDEDAYTSMTAYLVHRLGVSPGRAKGMVELARSLRQMPTVRSEAEKGLISVDKLRVLAHARSRHPDEFPEVEALFTRQARQLSVRELRRVVDYWSQALLEADDDPDPGVRPGLRASRNLDGSVHLEADLAAEAGERVMAAVDAIAGDRLHKADETDRRGLSELRADALVDLADRYLTSTDRPQVGGERPHLSVSVDLPTLCGDDYTLAETSTGSLLHPRVLRRIACDAAVRRVVLDADGHPLDVGRATRTVPPAIRAAVVGRDRQCIFPGCDRPPDWCDAHHVIHWTDGGPTAVWNLVLVCRHHHRAVHELGFGLTHDGKGGLTITRPTGSTLARLLDHVGTHHPGYPHAPP